MKPKELREKTTEELKGQLDELAEQLFGLKSKHAIGQLEQTANIKRTRRNIARIKTVLREREVQEVEESKK